MRAIAKKATLLALLLGATASWADDTKSRPDPNAPEVEEDVETVTGKAPPPLPSEPGKGAATAEELEEFENREHPPSVYRGAEQLGMDVEFVNGIHEGLELLYKRDYAGSRSHFETLEQSWPGTGVAAVGQTLIWQALMLENFDFKYEKQWEVASSAAESALRSQLEVPGNDGWEHFLLAGVVGIDSIHNMRRENYLPALQRAFEAMDEIFEARAAVPDFVDLTLADGMYNYWRTVVTVNSKVLPDFGDHRVEGIEAMETVATTGVFLAQPAALGLAFTWLEEREFKKALTECLRSYRDYPDNVINNLVLGRTYLYLNKPDSALRVFDEIVADAPDNTRVHYYRGLALQRSGQLDDAKVAIERYLAAPYMEDYQRAAAHFRLGQITERLGDKEAAELQYKEAVKVDGHKGAKSAIDRLKKEARGR
jgi:tetratricopeptide (TPR) repeat protein